MNGQCQKRGCDRPATHALKICVPVEGDDTESTLLIGVKLCEPCVEEADPQRFLDADETLKRYLGLAQIGKTLLWDGARIDGVVLGSAEHVELDRYRMGLN